MKLQFVEKTDEQRRLALQLALQLPDGVEDARRVLALTAQCLDEFMIERAAELSPWQRARRLGWRVEASAADAATAVGDEVTPTAGRAVCWALATLLLSAPLAMALSHAFIYGAGLCFGFAVITVAVIFGGMPALLLAVVTPFIHNFLVLPPALTFEVPTEREYVHAGFYVIFALAMPPLMRRLGDLRRLAAGPLMRG